ncbi:MAG: deoxyhypusine synthase family protein [Candidatus Lokiarchaeota archaeon]|nr:deoxyhypusine synthase family protein [Candidatus Lokiarchaeota archaeon]
MKNVRQIKINENLQLKKLIDDLENTGFNAKRLANACKIYERMVKDKECTIFFSLAGAMVPAGMQNILIDMIESGFIDILVTTGANLTHDIAEALGFHHLQGNLAIEDKTDKDLHDDHINRIYDVFMPNNVYEGMEDFIKTLDFDLNMSVKDFLTYLGHQLPDEPKSVLKTCANHEIPIFCPAFTDCGLAMQLSFSYPKINLNHFQDLQDMINLAWDAKTAGVCIIGGGVPKNYVLQAMQFSPNSAQFAIQITMDRPETGGLSGAELREAISWGKINEKAQFSTVVTDATIALPIILSYLKTVT